MPGQVRISDPRAQVVRLQTDATAPDSLDPRSQQIFSVITVAVVLGVYELVHNTLRQRFRTQVEIPQSLVTIYDNDPEKPPENAIWARFSVQHEGAMTKTTGGQDQVHRKFGHALVKLMAPVEAGDQELLALADAVDAAFLGVTSTLIYGTPSIDIAGRDGRWWVVEVRAPWRHDDVAVPNPAGGGFDLPNFETLHNAVRTRFQDQVETPESVIVIYDNSPIKPPEDSMFVRMAVRPGVSFRAENGGAAGRNRFRTPGVLMATIFAPLEGGDRAMLQLADVINTAFRAITAAGVTYQTPRVTNRGRDEDGRFWRIAVTCPFYSDEIA